MASRVRVTVRLDRNAATALIHAPGVQAEMDRRAARVLARQKDIVPVDTGELSNDLEIRKTPEGGRRIGSFNKDYAAAVETGHETSAGTWVPAQPYIRPSLDAARD